jgi:hypothetical protein
MKIPPYFCILNNSTMTVKELTDVLLRIKPSLQNTEIKVRYQNGEWHSPDIKFMLKEMSNLDKTPENVEFIALNH